MAPLTELMVQLRQHQPGGTKSAFFIFTDTVKYTISLTGMMELASLSKFMAMCILTRPNWCVRFSKFHVEKSMALAAFALLGLLLAGKALG